MHHPVTFRSFFYENEKNVTWNHIKNADLILQNPQLSSSLIFIQGNDYQVTNFKITKCILCRQIDEQNSFILDIKNTLVLKINEENTLRFLNTQQPFDLLFGNEIEYEEWLSILKNIVIFLSFKSFYEIRASLGKGSFAEVFLVKNLQTKIKYAMKSFIKEKLLNDPIEQQAISKEIDIMRNLKHPNLLKFREVFEDEQKIYICNDLLLGGELLKHYFSKDTKKGETQVSFYIHQLFLALTYLSSQNIIHRDIKPENLLLKDKEGTQLCIVDFGLADYYREKGDYLFVKCGTPGFVAPEILSDEPYDFKVDVFSVGVIMYAMLTGTLPFKSKNYEEIVQKNFDCIINFNFKNPITEQAKDLLKKTLARDPKQRISAQEAIQHPWFNSFKQGQQGELDFDFEQPVEDEFPAILQTNKTGLIQRNAGIINTKYFDSSPLSSPGYKQLQQIKSKKYYSDQINNSVGIKTIDQNEDNDGRRQSNLTQVSGLQLKKCYEENEGSEDSINTEEFTEGQLLSPKLKLSAQMTIRKSSISSKFGSAIKDQIQEGDPKRFEI